MQTDTDLTGTVPAPGADQPGRPGRAARRPGRRDSARRRDGGTGGEGHRLRPGRARQLQRAASVRALVTGLCWALVLAQLIGLMAWSWHLLGLANMGWDYAIYYQPWYLIAHGHLLPRNTVQGGYLFVRNDGELVVYLLAPLYWLFPNHMLGYLWLQDLAIAAVTATCLVLVTELLPWRTQAPRREQAIAGTARLLVVLLVVLDPWVYWVASFDVHMEVFGACFALLSLRAALQRRRSTAVWALLTVLCGAASTLYLAGVGLTATVVLAWPLKAELFPRLSRRAADTTPGHAPPRFGPRPSFVHAAWPLGLTVTAVVWLAALGALHATVGSPSQFYAYLLPAHGGQAPTALDAAIGVLEHPGRALSVLAAHGWNLWANTSPAGFVGLFSPAFFLAAPPLLSNNLLDTEAFSYPSFQSFFVYGALPLGSVAVAVWLLRRRSSWLSPAGAVLVVAMLANSAGWFGAWFGTTAAQWIGMSPGSAAVVKQVAHEASAGDEVVASQGYLGMLAGRQQLFSFSGPIDVPIRSRTVWFVLSFTQGLQTATQSETLEAIDTVAHLPGVDTVRFDDNGVWVYRWHPGPGARSVALGEPGSPYPIWMTPGDAGVAITSGPSSGWSVSSSQHPGPLGYLFFHDYFQLTPGRYVAEVRLRSDRSVTPEVWSDEGTVQLVAGVKGGLTARRARTVRIPFTVPAGQGPPAAPARGSGLFRYQPIPPTPIATYEIRVWMPAGTVARAWWSAVVPVPPRP
jgi:hypothetical protein